MLPVKCPVPNKDLNRLEFHRNAVALMPDPGDKWPGIAIRVEAPSGRAGHRSCSCNVSRSKTCSHLKDLSRIRGQIRDKSKKMTLGDDFGSSIWYRFAKTMADGTSVKPETIRVATTETVLKIFSESGVPLLTYFSNNFDRFLERCTVSKEKKTIPARGDVIRQLALLTLTDDERVLMDMGLKTNRQTFEETFWYKVGYHGYQEFGADGCTFHPVIEKESGAFAVECRTSENHCVLSIIIPRIKVKQVLSGLKNGLCNEHGLAVDPIPLDAVFNVRLNKGMDIEIQPLLRLIQKDGEAKFFDREDLKRFQYGDLYYIEELGILAEDQYPKPSPEKFKDPVKTVIKKSQVPSFLEEFGPVLKGDTYQIDEKIKRLKIIRKFDRMKIAPESIDQDWCWLSVTYGIGNQKVSLGDILAAKQARQRYLTTDNGWIDCEAPAFQSLDVFSHRMPSDTGSGEKERLRLSRMDFFRLIAEDKDRVDFAGDPDRVDVLKKMLDMKPSLPFTGTQGMTSSLREYQKRGTEWLLFLFENGFGGLLCDDMGLGKTHQTMALMVWLRELKKAVHPYLLVCPTTVISHWEKKIREHAPDLKTAVYYGNQRDLAGAVDKNNVILTSYGILRRDILKINKIPFSIAVFDEIQNIKTRETQAYKAAETVQATIKLGLTGTPIENSLSELKTLLDVTTPGYMGTGDYFSRRYQVPIEQDRNIARQEELSRLISPFVLRRLKGTVLKELPEKIEDTRTCRLSEDQVKLYRDAVDTRASDLLDMLLQETESIPYMHIFALLNLLKQICNHPALAEGSVEEYERYASGKWDLFTELLSESLDSGQKVVVYSQYLGMLDIMESHIKGLNIGYAKLTGSSRNRGEIIDRFNNDPRCRLFLGSLRAGGTGIDLVAASVVIHYDRWWNAAREDQATDRVHRIGQRRGVQVFKLVTEGTLEEKIAAMIEKKRDLLYGVVKEDDPGLLKSFTREDLIEMLSVPQA